MGAKNGSVVVEADEERGVRRMASGADRPRRLGMILRLHREEPPHDRNRVNSGCSGKVLAVQPPASNGELILGCRRSCHVAQRYRGRVGPTSVSGAPKTIGDQATVRLAQRRS